MSLSQKKRLVAITSTFGSDALIFCRMTATEGLSSLSEYVIDCISDKADLRADKILGTFLCVALDGKSSTARHFSGIVTGFAYTGRQGRHAAYRAVVRPWLWLATLSADCRIFQDKSVIDIAKAVFSAYTQADIDTSSLAGDYAPLPYCVQYRESDFAFISRLFEQEGIYYFFRCDANRHTMVLADSYSAHKPAPGNAHLVYRADRSKGQQLTDTVGAWSVGTEIQTGSVTLDDYDFEKPANNLLVRSARSRTHDQGSHAVFDYPGRFVARGRGEAFARNRLESLQANYEIAEGETTARSIFPGSMFTLSAHPRSDQNRDYLMLSTQLVVAESDGEADEVVGGDAALAFDCRFQAMGKEQTFRSPRVTPWPTVQGPQTARVVGKAGEEIWTDKYGRIKVQFHWDRLGKQDEKSSCWVRVAQGWAGKRWGAQFLPRIGQEVVVSFLEGDPDQPLVTGAVYNTENMPPYELPAKATRSTIKSNSSKGGGGYNEIRIEDKKGAEQLYMRAEKDRDAWIKNDDKTWTGKDRHSIVKGESFEDVTGAAHSKIGGDRNDKVGGAASLDAGKEIHMKAGMLYAVQAGKEIHLKAGANLVIEAGASITLKAGGGSVVIGPTSVAVTGSPILLNSGGKAGKASGAKPKPPKEPKPADDGKK